MVREKEKSVQAIKEEGKLIDLKSAVEHSNMLVGIWTYSYWF